MAAICDMALGRLGDHRYFLGIVHDWIKTGFTRKKEARSYIQMVFIVCCLLLTAPNKGKIISVSHVTDGVFWVCTTMLWLVHNGKLKNCLSFVSRYKINYSHYFWGGWRGVLQWCNVWAHKIIISACTIDFWPTLMYQSTSADLQQQHLTSFCTVCGLLFY